MKTLFLVLVLFSAFVTGCSSGGNEASAPPSSSANANETASAAPKPSPPAPNTLPLLPPPPPPGLPELKQEIKPQTKPAASAAAKPSAIASQPVSNAMAPRLILPVGNIDFGSVSQGKSLVRNLVVKNNGKGDLNIESVAPS